VSFVKGLDRKQRFDMNKSGLEVTAKSIGTTTEAQPSAEAAQVERSVRPEMSPIFALCHQLPDNSR